MVPQFSFSQARFDLVIFHFYVNCLLLHKKHDITITLGAPHQVGEIYLSILPMVTTL